MNNITNTNTNWAPAGDRIMTDFAADVSPDNAWAEYPRPQMARKEWKNLNGLWDYLVEGEEEEWTLGRIENALADPLLKIEYKKIDKWDGKILVPYCIESALSGVGRLVKPNQMLWYCRSFTISEEWTGKNIILHFGAVDWHAVVWVNGSKVGEHKGGYVPFSFDITEALKSGDQEITVAVWDPTNAGDQAIGKQSIPELKKGYRYTPTTGIWQTVWLEPVSRTSIKGLKITPDLDNQQVEVETFLLGNADNCQVSIEISDNGKVVAAISGSTSLILNTTSSFSERQSSVRLTLKIDSPKLWTPDSPFLYDLKIILKKNNELIDSVASYFGMRKISLGKDSQGFTRILLNNEPIFQFGPLDQGYWPESTLTPPSDSACEFDIKYLKDIGCNMIRVHIKLHPSRWYYHCDRLGLLVWQDMVCTRKFEQKITAESARQFEWEQEEMIGHLRNHPSIVKWIVFNEAWGQYDTERLTKWTMELDSSRLVSNASGWFDRDAGHEYDVHDYSFHPTIPLQGQTGDRAVIVGECGGFDVILPEHSWYPNFKLELKNNSVMVSGREKYKDGDDWLPRYKYWLEGIRSLIGLGCCAAVYTQITDVEHEPNGWLTYDRKVSKIDKDVLKELHEKLYLNPVEKAADPLVSFTDMENTWNYNLKEWFEPDYSEKWMNGQAPFGTDSFRTDSFVTDTNGIKINTLWNNEAIYLKKSFMLKEIPEKMAIRVAGIGDIELYLNGILIKKINDFSNTKLRTRPMVFTADVVLTEKEISLLKTGNNLIAVSCRNKNDEKYIDVKIVSK